MPAGAGHLAAIGGRPAALQRLPGGRDPPVPGLAPWKLRQRHGDGYAHLHSPGLDRAQPTLPTDDGGLDRAAAGETATVCGPLVI
jgi:hypothetical protein